MTAAAAVDLLTRAKALRYLHPFLMAEHTLTTAARAAQLKPTSMAYWLPKFERAGLVGELRRERRAGAAMPVYRAVARRLVVPYAAMPVDRRIALLDSGRERILRRFLDGLDEVMERRREVGFAYSAAGSGVAIQVDGIDSGGPYTDAWGPLRLTAGQAASLAAEMEALVAKYQGGTSGSYYVIHAGVVAEPRRRYRSATDSR
jgi:hypothetical protein